MKGFKEMEVLWIVLGSFVAVLAIIGLTFLTSDIQEKSNNQKMQEYFSDAGKKEIDALESFMKQNNISIPERGDDNELDYIKSLIYDTIEHFECGLIHDLENAGYEECFDLYKIGRIYYNSEHALIYKDVFIYVKPCVKNGVASYTYFSDSGQSCYLTLTDLLEFCTKLGEPNAYKDLAKEVALDDLHWYVEYPASAGHRLADTGAGAIVGGLLLGPVGAIAGAMSSSKSSGEKEKNEVEVFFVQDSVSYSVAKGEDNVDQTIKELSEHLPNNRWPDSYKKHM